MGVVKKNELEVMCRTGMPTSSVIIYRGELEYISRCILDYPNIETGGQLFGFWTAAGVPVVLYAIGPGPNANHQVAFFNQDIDYLLTVGKGIASRFGLQHIGEWHSHHQLGLAHPSGHDAATIAHGIKRQNLGRFLLCIGICEDGVSNINPYNFTQDSDLNYTSATWDIKESNSPFRQLVDSDLELGRVLIHPRTETAKSRPLRTVGTSELLAVPSFEEDYWLSKKDNNRVLKEIVDELGGDEQCRVQMDSQRMVRLLVSKEDGDMRVIFPKGFPDVPPIVMFENAVAAHSDIPWENLGGIKDSVVKFIRSHCPGVKEKENGPATT